MLMEKTKEHTSNWVQIPDHPYIVTIICGSGSRKTNTLVLINYQPNIDKIYLYVKDPFGSKY